MPCFEKDNPFVANYAEIFLRNTNSCYPLAQWDRVTHICVSELTTIGPDNGLSPGRRQAIIWTNAGIVLIGPSGTNFNEILIEIHTFLFKKIHLKMSPAKWRPFCLGLNVLTFIWCSWKPPIQQQHIFSGKGEFCWCKGHAHVISLP